LHFYTSGANGSYAAETGADGIVLLNTSTADNNTAALMFGAMSPRPWANLNTQPAGRWWEWGLKAVQATTVRQGGGLASGSGPTNDGVHFNQDTDGSETTWKFFSRNSTTDSTRIDSAVTVTPGKWYRIRVTVIDDPAQGVQFQVSAAQDTEAAAKTAALGTAFDICPHATCDVNASIDTDDVASYFAATNRHDSSVAASMGAGFFCWSAAGWQ
jgi:hypothetical protein